MRDRLIYWISYYDDDGKEIVVGKLVHCVDCVYYNAREGFCEYLSNNYAPAVTMEENDFCSKGKRREDK